MCNDFPIFVTILLCFCNYSPIFVTILLFSVTGGVLCTEQQLRGGTRSRGGAGGESISGIGVGGYIEPDMEAAGSGGGDADGVDPSELFSELGLLVVESRVPEKSSKGRSQGAHCPLTLGIHPQRHRCLPKRLEVSTRWNHQIFVSRVTFYSFSHNL